MAQTGNKIDSNITGLAYAEEESLKVLPDAVANSGNQDGAVWYNLEPNEYDDFGSEIETVARDPINPSRQKKKGVVVDLDASGGFSTDLTQTNLQRLMQGFMFADAREKAGNQSLVRSVGDDAVVSHNATGAITLTTSTVADDFAPGMLVKVSGAVNSVNNRVGVVQAVAGAVVTLDNPGGLVTEATATIKLEVVGFECADGAVAMVLNVGNLQLTNGSDDWTTLGLVPGEWIYIGGDDVTERFNTNAAGFARVYSVTAGTLTLTQVSWANPASEAAVAGKTIRIFFGTVIRNEKDATLIKCRSYQLERTLGRDSNGIQSEYLVGAVANEFKMNFASTDKLVCDLSFVGVDNELRNGAQGVKPGNHVDPPLEDAFNTSSNVSQLRLYVHDDAAVTPGSLFGFVEEGEVTINNNVSGLKAIGELGSFDINVGTFDVSGELSVYFATVEAIRAVRNNADVGFNAIGVRDNAGWVFDIPLLSLGGGRAAVEKDTPIMLPLEKMGAENEFGYTLLTCWFGYLPDVAMDA